MAKKASKPQPTLPAPAAAEPASPTAGIVIETVAVASLLSDPRNARLHGEKNLASIVASLKRFGQQKPLVVDGDGVVIAGNGTLAAAKQLGWPTVQIHRTRLTGAEARAFAIADNRTAELAEWDVDELNATLSELDASGLDLDMAELGITDADLAALADEDFPAAHGFAPKREKEEKPPEPVEITPVFKIIVTCATEAEQAKYIRYLEREGAEFKAPSV